jgi:hypothetical protein
MVFDVPEVTTLAYDETRNVVTASAEISHFSTFSAETAAKVFTVSASPTSGTFSVNQSFNYTVTVAPGPHRYTNTFLPWGEDRERRAVHTDVELTVGNGTRWWVDRCSTNNCATIFTFLPDVLAPAEQDFIGRDMAATESYRQDYPLTCAKKGDAYASMRGAFAIRFTLQVESKQRGEGIPENARPYIFRERQYLISSIPHNMAGQFTCQEWEQIGPPILCDPTGTHPNLQPCPPDVSTGEEQTQGKTEQGQAAQGQGAQGTGQSGITVCGGILGPPCPE